jgi:hypothetical protein
MRRKLTLAEKIRGTTRALASSRTPAQLRPGLKRYLTQLQREFDRLAVRRSVRRVKKHSKPFWELF